MSATIKGQYKFIIHVGVLFRVERDTSNYVEIVSGQPGSMGYMVILAVKK